MRTCVLYLVMAMSSSVIAQLPYTESNYNYSVESDLMYGTATGFDGFTDTLLLDIYRPVSDDNCRRPCLILVHGGAWLAGSKIEGSIPLIAADFAQKGWVVAAINYRLGMHLQSNYTQYWACTPDLAQPCGYMADSLEVGRAIYRAQQDVKGAIRFMKNRSLIDSTDIENVYLCGESAGGFNVLTAAFLDDPLEKFPDAFTIASPLPPDPDLVSCLESGYSLLRPDLGPINGTLNTGNHDARVQGVGSIYGGLLNLNLLANETDWPALYFFHQGSDVIVNYNFGRLLGRLDNECLSIGNICQPYSVTPTAHGSKSIANYLNGLPSPPALTAEIIENYEYNNDCFDNGHSLDDWSLRVQQMRAVFAQRIVTTGNIGPSCILGIDPTAVPTFKVFPNPSSGQITISSPDNTPYTYCVTDLTGKKLNQGTNLHTTEIHLPVGSYILEIEHPYGSVYKRLIVAR